MIELLSQPWPWYVAGPIIGLFVPALLLFRGTRFGISSSLRHMCSAVAPGDLGYLKYDWKEKGLWNLTFIAGIVLGGFLVMTFLESPEKIDLAPATVAALNDLGISDLSGMVPSELISWEGLTSTAGFISIVGGGFLLGFGARYAGGCTSGHAITGLAELQIASLVAVMGFFAGGLIVTYVLLPMIL